MSQHHKRATGGSRAWDRLRREALDRAGWRCERCGLCRRFEVHHVIPLREGGTNILENIKVLCRACHLAEHVRAPVANPWDRLVAELLP